MTKKVGTGRGNSEKLENLEDILSGAFEPVAPRADYVKDLNRRLSQFPAQVPEIVDPAVPLNTLGLVLGMITGISLIVLLARVVIPLLLHMRRSA